MCGRLNISDSPGVRALCEQLDIALWPEDGQRFSRFMRATDRVSIVQEADGQRHMTNAIWWLLLTSSPQPDGQVLLKPSRYTSFNTRFDKLNTPGSAGFKAFRQQRCVIPVSGFGESQKTEAGMRYYDMLAAEETGMLMGGLYRLWQFQDPLGQPRYQHSCSVVTLPPHPKLKRFHQKSTPLMLSMHDGSAERWLDATCTEPDALADLLQPRIRQGLTILPVDKPSTHQVIGDPIQLAADN